MERLNQQQYKELKHKMYEIHYVADNDGNYWIVYKQHITEYSGIYKRSYGCQFVIVDELTNYKVTRSSKQNVLKFLNKY